MGTGKFSSNPDVTPRKFEECKGTGDTGENSFTVYVPELLQGQIGRNDGGTSGYCPFIQNLEELGYRKGVGNFRSHVIKDQKVTFQKRLIGLPELFGTVSYGAGQQFK